MSKHQSCRECRRDFVGPDGNIPDNLCPECDEVIHAECHEEILQLEVAAKGMAVELSDYAKTVAKLRAANAKQAETLGTWRDRAEALSELATCYRLCRGASESLLKRLDSSGNRVQQLKKEDKP